MSATDTIQSNGVATAMSGNKPTAEQIKAARELLKAARTPAQRRKPGGITPVASGKESQTACEYHGLVNKTPVDWESVELYQEFCLSPDGSHRHVKVSKSKAANLQTKKARPVGHGQVYLLDLPGLPSKPF